MKLFELFDTDVKTNKSNNEYSELSRLAASRKREMMIRSGKGKENSGVHGRIHADRNDPHVVHKFNHRHQADLNKDGYYAYIKTVVSERLAQENPFYPRVYDVKSYTDSAGKSRFKIKLEKLIPLKELSVEQLKAVLRSLFNIEDIKDIMHNEFNFVRLVSPGPGQKRALYANTLSNLMFKAFNKEVEPENELLVAIINKIEQISAANGNWIDIHSGNYMFRLGRGIPQMVITDPLA